MLYNLGSVYLLSSTPLCVVSSCAIKGLSSVLCAAYKAFNSKTYVESDLGVREVFCSELIPSVCSILFVVPFFLFRAYVGPVSIIAFTLSMSICKFVGLSSEAYYGNTYVHMKEYFICMYGTCIAAANMFGSCLLSNVAMLLDIALSLMYILKNIFDSKHEQSVVTGERKTDTNVLLDNKKEETVRDLTVVENVVLDKDKSTAITINKPADAKEETSDKDSEIRKEADASNVEQVMPVTDMRSVCVERQKLEKLKDIISNSRKNLEQVRKLFNEVCVGGFKNVAAEALSKKQLLATRNIDIDCMVSSKRKEMRLLINKVQSSYKHASSGLKVRLKSIKSMLVSSSVPNNDEVCHETQLVNEVISLVQDSVSVVSSASDEACALIASVSKAIYST